MLFMVIEHFKDRDAVAIYRRVREEGRRLPEGLRYVGSWVEANFDRCFQLMECDDLGLLQRWAADWHGYGYFDVVLVLTSEETQRVVAPLL